MQILDAIGNTPMARINGVYAKLEYLNPSGSIKDRIAKYIVEKAEHNGELRKGYTIVEATSGNTGIAFSLQASLRGYKMIAVMPRGLSKERAEIMKAYGTKIIHPKHDCFTCAIELTHKYNKKGYYLPRQFENNWNVEENFKILGSEILKEIKADCFVAGVGTGGTVIGVGMALKKSKKTWIAALEPTECALMTQYGIGKIHCPCKKCIDAARRSLTCKKHGIEGIGDGIVPDIIKRNKALIDEVVTVDTKHAINMARWLSKNGYFVGPSSGANMVAALKLKKRFRNVVTVLPDRGDRYLSEGIY